MKYDHLIGKGFHRWTSGSYTPGQLEALADTSNTYILLSGSYRSGKTELMARAVIRHIYLYQSSQFGVFRQFQTSLKKSTLRTILELIHPSWVASWSNTELELRLKNDSTILFIGCDRPDRLGSIELTGAAIDEASEVTEESLGMIQGRLSGQLSLPSNFHSQPRTTQDYLLNNVNYRQTFLACNPKSPKHYLYSRFIKSPQPGHICYNSNSISNPNLPESYLVNSLAAYTKPGVTVDWIIDEVRKIRNGQAPPDGLHLQPYLTQFGQRNLLGLWVALEGAIYPELDSSIHLVDQVPSSWGQPTGNYYAGVDHGYHNPRIIVLQEYKPAHNPIAHYAAISYWVDTDSSGDDMVHRLQELDNQYGLTRVFMPHDQPAIKKLAAKTLGPSRVRKAKTSVMDGITTVTRFISQSRLLFLPGPNRETCWNELSGYQWKQHRDGYYIDEPVKADDHFPDSLRYLLTTLHHRDRLTEKPEPLPTRDQFLDAARLF